MTWIAPRRLVVAPDGSRVLDADEPQTGILLAAAGAAVSDDECRRYGLGPYAEATGEAGPPDAYVPVVTPGARRGRDRGRHR